jgi:AGCS family alanine or glycine:cation symporter
MGLCVVEAVDLKLLDYIDCFFRYTTFYKVPIINLPISIFFTLVVAFYFFIKLDFAPIKLFKHSLDIVKDKYTDKNAPGDFTPKQAIYTAALGTVGLGSVGGMAVAIGFGGPGAVFWIIVMGVVLSVLKFSEIALGHKFRTVDFEKKTAHGGPFQYISESFKMLKMPVFGKFIGKFYGFVMLFAVFFSTNMFQCGQTALVLGENVSFLSQTKSGEFLSNIIGNSGAITTNIYCWILGGIATFLIGITIMGGMSGVAKVAGALVPFMTVSYVVSAIIILFVNVTKLPAAFSLIISEAFNYKAITGGMMGGIAYGSLRSIYTSESGAGTSAISHSSAKTKEHIMEGCTGFIEVLFPMIVCLMTGLIVVATNSHTISGAVGVVMTSNAFASVASWFPIILTIQVPFLALTTAIAWGLYGDRVWKYLFGDSMPDWIFKIIYLTFTFGGFVIIDQTLIIRLADYIWISMVVPNVITLFMMRNIIKADLDDYLRRLKSGEIRMIS